MSGAVYVLGAPGVGKSTLLAGLLAGWKRRPAVRVRGQMWVEPLCDAGGARVGAVLGRSRVTFSGTDALGMAVMPDALGWLAERGPYSNGDLFGEGARLGTARFLVSLSVDRPTTALLLELEPEELEARWASRASPQDARWRLGAATRARRAAERAEALGVEVIPLSASGSPDEVCARATIALRGGLFSEHAQGR